MGMTCRWRFCNFEDGVREKSGRVEDDDLVRTEAPEVATRPIRTTGFGSNQFVVADDLHFFHAAYPQPDLVASIPEHEDATGGVVGCRRQGQQPAQIDHRSEFPTQID